MGKLTRSKRAMPRRHSSFHTAGLAVKSAVRMGKLTRSKRAMPRRHSSFHTAGLAVKSAVRMGKLTRSKRTEKTDDEQARTRFAIERLGGEVSSLKSGRLRAAAMAVRFTIKANNDGIRSKRKTGRGNTEQERQSEASQSGTPGGAIELTSLWPANPLFVPDAVETPSSSTGAPGGGVAKQGRKTKRTKKNISLKAATHAVRIGKQQFRKRRFSKFETVDGDCYFVPESGGESVWDLPAAAVVVEM
jgi:hypothetical protein